MDTLLQDLRYAIRRLLRSRGFTAVAILTLALGIGANSAIFSVVNGVLLKPLPYREPGRLVEVQHANPGKGVEGAPFSPQNFEDLRRASTSFENLAAYLFWPGLTGMDLRSGGEPRRLETAFVSGNFFQTLGVPAAAGRPLIPAEDAPGPDRVVVLSDALWQSRFGADPGVVGRTVSLDGEPFTVVGVMPASFQYPAPGPDAWVPISRVTENMIPHRRGIRWMGVVGRLKPGVSPETATRETSSIMERLAAEYPEANDGWTSARLVGLQKAAVGEVEPALLLLFGAVGLVLLIACANLANLLLARTNGRGREVALRTALGAGRSRLVRQLLTETVLLALAGGALGLLLAWWGVEALVALSAGSIPRPEAIRVDAQVVAFTLAVSLATVCLVGLVPALRASGAAPSGVLKEGGRTGSEGRRRQGARNALVVAETALATVLLIGSGLMIRSFVELVRVDPGFRSENVLTLGISVSQFDYPSLEAWEAHRREILRSIAAVPGVRSVGASKTVPLQGSGESFHLTVQRGNSSTAVQPEGGAYFVTPGYFHALGIQLLQGRTFTDQDDTDAPPVLVVNRAFARKYWPDGKAVGKRLYTEQRLQPSEHGVALEVVGVVGDVRMQSLSDAPLPAIYLASAQAPRSSMKLFVRTAGNPAAVADAVRQAIWSVDPAQPIADMATMKQVMGEEVARPRFFTLLLGIFGGLALVLASIGLYGVVSYSVSQRTQEIGIRMALGAQRDDVLAAVVARPMLLVGAGLVIGVAGAFALTRLLTSLLYGVSTTDPITFAATGLLLAAVALLASYLPARRATRVDPVVALRAE